MLYKYLRYNPAAICEEADGETARGMKRRTRGRIIDKETLYEEPERDKDRQRDGEIEGRRRRYIGRDCRISY